MCTYEESRRIWEMDNEDKESRKICNEFDVVTSEQRKSHDLDGETLIRV
jgi:hypothetical protein